MCLDRCPTPGDLEVLRFLGARCGSYTTERDLREGLLGQGGTATVKMRISRLRERLGRRVVLNDYALGYTLLSCPPPCTSWDCVRCKRSVVVYNDGYVCDSCGATAPLSPDGSSPGLSRPRFVVARWLGDYNPRVCGVCATPAPRSWNGMRPI